MDAFCCIGLLDRRLCWVVLTGLVVYEHVGFIFRFGNRLGGWESSFGLARLVCFGNRFRSVWKVRFWLEI